MDVKEFIEIARASEDTWTFRVTPRLSTPGHFLYGGAGLASGIVALEEATGRPAIYAAAHYLSFAPLDAEVTVKVKVAAVGNRVTQARATTYVDDREILTVNAALGRGELAAPDPWLHMPEVPSPEDSPRRVTARPMDNTIFDHLETRVALGRPYEELDLTPGSPVSALWARVPDHLEPSAATLALIGDLVSGGATQPLGRHTMGRSLDNTIRVAALEPTEWVLCEIHMHALVHGFAQGTAYLWSESGTLLGTASQSMSAKYWDPPVD